MNVHMCPSNHHPSSEYACETKDEDVNNEPKESETGKDTRRNQILLIPDPDRNETGSNLSNPNLNQNPSITRTNKSPALAGIRTYRGVPRHPAHPPIHILPARGTGRPAAAQHNPAAELAGSTGSYDLHESIETRQAAVGSHWHKVDRYASGDERALLGIVLCCQT